MGHLRRRLHSAGVLGAASTSSSPCCFLPQCRTPSRRVHGGAGRGDLLFTNPDAWRHNKRTLGQLRGLRHGSQATFPESGQLHYRKLILHAIGEGPKSGSGHYRASACTWAYLLPSLMRCAELAVGETLWMKLCEIENDESGRETILLTEKERESVRSGQNLFRYELHQRLPLLEESVMSAELQELIRWFSVARRAWVRLPSKFTSSTTFSSDTTTTATNNDVIPVRSSLLPSSRDVFSHFEAPVGFRDAAAERNQIYNMASRVAQLTDIVVQRAEDEIARLSNDMDTEMGKPKSARLIAKEKETRQRFLDELRWHGMSNNAVLPLLKEVKETGGV